MRLTPEDLMRKPVEEMTQQEFDKWWWLADDPRFWKGRLTDEAAKPTTPTNETT